MGCGFDYIQGADLDWPRFLNEYMWASRPVEITGGAQNWLPKGALDAFAFENLVSEDRFGDIRGGVFGGEADVALSTFVLNMQGNTSTPSQEAKLFMGLVLPTRVVRGMALPVFNLSRLMFTHRHLWPFPPWIVQQVITGTSPLEKARMNLFV